MHLKRLLHSAVIAALVLAPAATAVTIAMPGTAVAGDRGGPGAHGRPDFSPKFLRMMKRGKSKHFREGRHDRRDWHDRDDEPVTDTPPDDGLDSRPPVVG